MPVTRLGGYARPGPLPPPGQMTIQPYPMPGPTGPPTTLGPPDPLSFGNRTTSPTLPPIGGPQPPATGGRHRRYLGGASGLPPRQGDGPPDPLDNGIGILGPEEPPMTGSWNEPSIRFKPVANRPAMLGPPRVGGNAAPVSGVGSNYDTAYPGGVGWRGPVLQPGVTRGYYSGPYARMPGTQGLKNPDGSTARGAAQIWSVLTQPGGALRGMAEQRGWPEFTAAQALAMRNSAIESMRTAPPDPFSDPAWYAWITSGAVGDPPRRNNGPDRGPFEETYDWEGNLLPPGAPGGGFGPEGGGGEWAGLSEDALTEWLRKNGMLGWNEREGGT